MPGKETYTNTWMDITFNSYWQYGLGDCVAPTTLSDWMREIYDVFNHRLELFKSVTTINVWHPDRSDCPAIKGYAGLCYPDGHIDLNAWYTDKDCLSHEFGHWVSLGSNMGPWADDSGRKMWQLYTNLRGSDFTSGTPGEERWAEDFRYFFGCNGSRGVVRSTDDGRRKPDGVKGLKDFIYHFKTVLDYWRSVGSVSNTSYDGAGCWMWSRKVWWWDQYEAYLDRVFYKWDNGRWVRTN